MLLFGHCHRGFDIAIAFILITFNYKSDCSENSTQHILYVFRFVFLCFCYCCSRWLHFFFFFLHLLNGTKSIMRIYLSKSQGSSIILSASFMRTQLHIFCKSGRNKTRKCKRIASIVNQQFFQKKTREKSFGMVFYSQSMHATSILKEKINEEEKRWRLITLEYFKSKFI